jgi:hypothetical protein
MQGKLGRSQGCFAVQRMTFPLVLARLGEGRLIYAEQIAAQSISWPFQLTPHQP